MCKSVPQMPARRTRINTSLMPIVGWGMSSSQSPGSRLLLTSAFMKRVGQVFDLPLVWHVLPQVAMRHLESQRVLGIEIRARPVGRSVQGILVLYAHRTLIPGTLQYREKRRPVDRAEAWQPIHPPLCAIHRIDSY